MNQFKRLLRYAAPYRGRMVLALAGMVVYAVGSAWLAWLIKDIVDVLTQSTAQEVGAAILVAYLLKGVGG